jgi:hypothetical protein
MPQFNAVTTQEVWEETFAKLGRSCPAQRADENDVDFQRRLSRIGRRYIPAGEQIARVKFDHTMPDVAVPKFAEMMRTAVERNMYRTDNMAPGEMKPIMVLDEQSGSRQRHWVGPDCFVKEMSQPCRRVVRINAPPTIPLYSAKAGMSGIW